MSLPKSRQDLTGNFVTSASADLNIPTGTEIASNTAVTSNEIAVPAGSNVISLIDLPSGTVNCKLSIYASAADFVTPTDEKTSLTGIPLYLFGQTTTANNKFKMQLQNQSGAGITPTVCSALVLQRLPGSGDFIAGTRGNASMSVVSTHVGEPGGSSGSGAFAITA